jgi:hypothetical protein
MFQNGMLAAIERDPRTRNLPLQLVNTIVTMKVMDGIMDFEVSHPGFGGSLLSEFFPGQLKKEEELWWNGRREHYDAIRFEDSFRRGIPLTMLYAKKEEKTKSSLHRENPASNSQLTEHHGPPRMDGDGANTDDQIDPENLLRCAEERWGIEPADDKRKKSSAGGEGSERVIRQMRVFRA